ncbi:MAG: hypothetical protein II567_12460 [Candidatus Riflebacteria bacterium]|nr:hypothetical protein [Candidatus Riflebacteria bacterium]
MNKRLCFSCILSLLLSPVFAASDLDLEKLKEKAKEYSSKGGGSSKKLEDLAVEPPKSRFIDSATKSLSEEDKRHILVHMKLANRHFSKKNYDKAKEEVNKVFERDPSHSGGHFMLAVIAGRMKDHLPAWYHITVAKEKDSGNKKIDDFITKLKTVSSEPDSPQWIPGIYNGIEIDASERIFDLLEKLLLDECSQNITSIESSDYQKQSNNKTNIELTFKARESLPGDKIISNLQKSNKSGIKTEENSSKNLKLTVTLNLNCENPNAKPIKGINDFINDLTEDMSEIAISNTEEGEPSNGFQEIIYEISVRDFSSLNKFMRRISPFASKFVLQNMDLAYVPGTQSTMWKAKIKVIYKV